MGYLSQAVSEYCVIVRNAALSVYCRGVPLCVVQRGHLNNYSDQCIQMPR